MTHLLYVIGILLLVFWVAGFIFKFIISPLIHLALFIGLVILAVNYFQDRRHRRPV